MRPRRKDRHLPACVYQRHGAYYLVKHGKWTRLGRDLARALEEYARLQERKTGAMAELVDAAMPGILRGLADSTQYQYGIAAEKIKLAFEEFHPTQIAQRHVAELQDGLSETPNMANRVLSVLRQVLDHAVRHQLIDSNPANGVKRLPELKRGRYLTDAEFDRIHAKAGDRLRVIMDLLYLTAQRPIDVLALKAHDFTDEGVVFQPRKTQNSTQVRLCVAWTPALKEAAERAKTHLKGRGGRVDYKTVQEQWTAACGAAKVADAQLRDIRAKSLTDAKREGKDAQALAGHASPSMTERYIRLRETPVVHGPSGRRKA